MCSCQSFCGCGPEKELNKFNEINLKIVASSLNIQFNCHLLITFNLLPNNKYLDWSEVKALADDKVDATRKFEFVL